jgi:hypothetical protein
MYICTSTALRGQGCSWTCTRQPDRLISYQILELNFLHANKPNLYLAALLLGLSDIINTAAAGSQWLGHGLSII